MGEELTFDYNFERYGDKPMRCYCGTKSCRKTVGGGAAEQLLGLDGALPPPVPGDDDASLDLPPLLVTEKELDNSVQAILDWRVGVEIGKDKHKNVMARLVGRAGSGVGTEGQGVRLASGYERTGKGKGGVCLDLKQGSAVWCLDQSNICQSLCSPHR